MRHVPLRPILVSVELERHVAIRHAFVVVIDLTSLLPFNCTRVLRTLLRLRSAKFLEIITSISFV